MIHNKISNCHNDSITNYFYELLIWLALKLYLNIFCYVLFYLLLARKKNTLQTPLSENKVDSLEKLGHGLRTRKVIQSSEC